MAKKPEPESRTPRGLVTLRLSPDEVALIEACASGNRSQWMRDVLVTIAGWWQKQGATTKPLEHVGRLVRLNELMSRTGKK